MVFLKNFSYTSSIDYLYNKCISIQNKIIADTWHGTKYHKACYQNNLEGLAALLAKDGIGKKNKRKLMDEPDAEGWTALHVASYMGRAEATAKLLATRADLGATTTIDQQTALHLACSKGHAGIVKLLTTSS